jgi:hypothetical protein
VVGRELFQKRFEPMAAADAVVRPLPWPLAVERLFELERTGDIKSARARRLAGFVCQASQNVPMHPRAEQRGKRELRELGIALTDQHLDSAAVDLASVVGATIGTKEWR